MGTFALKIDISKAFDGVDWDFLRDVMRCLGFSTLWVNWMFLCFSQVNYNVNFDGLLIGPIKHGRGLRQGDPLPPYLYLICAEVLSLLFSDAKRQGLIHGRWASSRCPRTSHLLFADDSLSFFQANVFEASQVQSILYEYERASGQSVNLGKSGILFSPNVSMELELNISAILAVHNPLGGALRRMVVWGSETYIAFNVAMLAWSQMESRECSFDSRDLLIWYYDKKGIYTVKSRYYVSLKGRKVLSCLLFWLGKYGISETSCWNQRGSSAVDIHTTAVKYLSDWQVYLPHEAVVTSISVLHRHARAAPSIQAHNFAWLCFVDGSMFTTKDFIRYGYVIEDSEGWFQRAVLGFQEGNGSAAVVEALALCSCFHMLVNFFL
ncbi:uncharacterized protein LOC119370422 [Jatropha curcas]|uniref:uncharacterized protein LOC119370422 n=1 Tax=Jatropha curcas TaxID=180498 RepID=UPI00189461A8|nr:uncharacterized protein LOC119370422 [Jatropha curcas]